MAAPSITSISPDVASTQGDTTITITGTGFLSGLNVFFGKIDFKFATDIVVVDANTVTVTVPVLPITNEPYDVVIQNPDLQAGTLASALSILQSGGILEDMIGYSSICSSDSPIYDIEKNVHNSCNKERVFGLGTNMEILFYSGRNVDSGQILNVQRKQLGTTSTRHASGDLVFKGIASIQLAPFAYETTDSTDYIGSIDCVLRSNGRIDMHLRKPNTTEFLDDAQILYATYQATLVRSIDPMPPLKIGTEDCE